MPELYPEDQAKVDKVLSQGIYQVERQRFRPWLLLTVLVGALGVVSIIGYFLAAAYDFI